jgi:hypothetical protein
VLLHELGHFAGNKEHRPRCSNSPMIESLAKGEWWRSSDDWFNWNCAKSPSSPAAGAGASKRSRRPVTKKKPPAKKNPAPRKRRL